MVRLFLAGLMVGWAMSAAAQTADFDIALAGSRIGSMSIQTDGTRHTMRGVIDNSPLGIADGNFSAQSAPAGNARNYAIETRKRSIEITFDGDRAQTTRISPDSELTELSNPAAAPAGVIDPAATLARFVRANGCPAPFRIYDGRRAIAVSNTGETTENGVKTCNLSYVVTHGPGHASPFKFRNIGLVARYGDGADGPATLLYLSATTNLFTVELSRN